ncbi:type IV pilin protein [Psychrobacter sp. S1-30-MNA-CIBAN-0213]|uniref:type IV pilin protein n=1 Tax=Psychrobacter sp. S1-30-MNA-CIBAN-0213 TaxID=3140456 RepID=UPI003320EDE2
MVISSSSKKASKAHMLSRKHLEQKGFTLIELMIVVAIIGILAAITIPSYQAYVTKTKRGDMMVELQQVASRIESNKINYKRYDRIPLSSVLSGTVATDGSANFPIAGTALYTVTVTPNNSTTLSDSDWTVTAAPVTGQQMVSDGAVSLDNQGNKCRVISGTKKCSTGDDWN